MVQYGQMQHLIGKVITHLIVYLLRHMMVHQLGILRMVCQIHKIFNLMYKLLMLMMYHQVNIFIEQKKNNETHQIIFYLVFFNTSVTISINETTANGSGILNLTITDTDFDTILNLGILSGNIKNVFEFILLSDNLADTTRTEYQVIGQLYVVGPLSYEFISSYSLVLFAFDTQNLARINVTVNLIPQNTKAPYFTLMPGFTAYEYQVTEGTTISALNGPVVSFF